MRWHNVGQFAKSWPMKNIITLTILIAGLSAQAELPIKNSFALTSQVFRGSQPLGKAEALRDAGVDQVLIFKNDTKGEVERETSELLAAGFSERNIHHIPMPWKNINLKSACFQTVEALKILADAERRNKSIFFHCTVGEDRTGMLAGLYQMLSNHVSMIDVFDNEMCGRGYADGNSNKPAYVVNSIEEGLTPLFIAMATEIEKSQMDLSDLSGEMCDHLKISDEILSCH
jgi:hypothetical protein